MWPCTAELDDRGVVTPRPVTTSERCAAPGLPRYAEAVDRHRPGDQDRRSWPTGLGTAVGLAMGAALGSTIFDSLALSTGIGLVIGAVVDLRNRRS